MDVDDDVQDDRSQQSSSLDGVSDEKTQQRLHVFDPPLPRLSRSPHPYHHLQQANDALMLLSPPATAASDSGTEADDEHFLKGLPAPRTRPHKGLRGLNEVATTVSSGVSTPLWSPAQRSSDGTGGMDTDGQGEKDKGKDTDKKKDEVEDKRKIKNKNTYSNTKTTNTTIQRSSRRRRRRREIVRRSTEVLLLVVLGGLLCSHPEARPQVVRWRRELRVSAAAVAGLCAAYPLRVVLWTRRSGSSSSSSLPSTRRFPLRLPSSFDPAPLLYPLVVPVFVSLLLATPTLPVAPLLNLTLSLCSIPKQLIPFSESAEIYAPVQWAVSCLPVFTASRHSSAQNLSNVQLQPPLATLPSFLPQPFSHLPAEAVTLLYPLHQTLCWLLHDLTTTSLLPAELQLLSTALVNLLLLALSPQAIILQAVLWGGALGLLITSEPVIRWGITLARVPRWRFRRVTSNSDEEEVSSFSSKLWTVWRFLRSPRRARLELMFGSGGGNWDEDENEQETTEVRRRRSKVDKAAESDSEGLGNSTLSLRNSTLTVSTVPSMKQTHTKQTHTPSGRLKRSASASVRSFFSLTQTQATRRKWLYALWVYGSVVAVVLGGLRWYVGQYALQGREPVGWALGYLLGDQRWFRLEVVKANWENWVCLPERDEESGLIVLPKKWNWEGFLFLGRQITSFLSSSTPSSSLGLVETLRRTVGRANTRLWMAGYWGAVLATGLATVLTLSPLCEVDTRRKVFHFTMVAMLLPATFVDPACAALALALALAVFLVVDLLRASQLPPLSRPIATFLAPYVDGRDLRGPVVISHIFLLIGCAIPLWLSLAGLPRERASSSSSNCLDGWELPTREVSMVAGVVCVGLGDAAASLVGRRWGRRKWLWGGGKSLEGSLAFATAVFLGLMAATVWLHIGWRSPLSSSSSSFLPSTSPPPTPASLWDRSVATVPRAGVCATVASLTEAVLTGGNDNVVVPVILWTCVKSLGL